MPKKKKTSRKRRVLSGLSGTRGGCKRVSRSKATHRSGKKKGKLKKGCRFLKGDGAQCCPAGSKRKTKRRSSKRKTSKKTAKKTGHYYPSRSSLPFYKKKVKGKKKLKKGCSKVTRGKYKGKIRCKRKMSSSRRKAA